jgi:hypothetical protein
MNASIEEEFPPAWVDSLPTAKSLAVSYNELRERALALESAVIEFLAIADEVAESRRGFTRFIELADRIDPQSDDEE